MHRICLTIAAAAACHLLAPSPATAQDFGCGSARNAAEATICASRTLSAMDESMARLYGRLWELYGQRHFAADDRLQLRDRQRAFLGSRDACGSDARCIRAAYDDHIGELATALRRARRTARG